MTHARIERRGRGPIALLRLLTALAGAGCASDSVEPDKGGDSGEAGGQIDLQPDAFDGDGPVLVEASAGRSGSTCFVEATYDDPQGPADVRRGTVEAVDLRTGEVVWHDDLFVCIDFGCIGSFTDAHAQYSDAPCAQLGRSYALHGFVYDRTGLESNRLVLELE